MNILALRVHSLLALLDGHWQSPPFQLPNQPFALLVPIPSVIVIAPLRLVYRTGLSDVVDDRQDAMAHGNARFLLAYPFHQAFVLCRREVSLC